MVLMALSAVTYAKPVYLVCTTTYQGDPPSAFSVSIDEETGKVTNSYSTGTAFNADGFFSANEVSYKSVSCGGGMCMTSQFTIDRRTLAVRKVFRIEAINSKLGIPPKDLVSSGQCAIEEVGERKF